MDTEFSSNDLFSQLEKYQDTPRVMIDSQSPKINYTNLDKQFKFNIKQQKPVQYASIYQTRLHMIQRFLKRKLTKKEQQPVEVIKLKKGKMHFVIALIYKEMKLKPSAFDDNKFLDRDFQKSMISDDDKIYLEDQTGRVELDLSQIHPITDKESDGYGFLGLKPKGSLLNINDFVTGQVVGVFGKLNAKGIFIVQEVTFPGFNIMKKNAKIYKELQSKFHQKQNECLYSLKHYLNTDLKSNFIAMVSGLNINSQTGQRDLDRLKQFLFGDSQRGGIYNLSQRIQRLIIAGDSIMEQDQLHLSLQGAFKVQEIYNEIFQEEKKSLQEFDGFMQNIAQKMQVDIMPGEKDPSDNFIPQQPLDSCFFPKAFKYESLNLCTNPHKFDINGRQFLGTSGQNIQDIEKYSNFSENGLKLLEATLLWRHLAPTAPDTLGCHSFTDEDPFYIYQIPNVYFAGNMKKFETKLIVNDETQTFVRLLTIPKFCETQKVILINVDTLDCFDIKIR